MGIVIRPAGIYMAPAYSIFLLISLVRINNHSKWFYLSLSITSIVMLLLPQLLINYKYYNILTIFPSYSLGEKQIEWGISVLKYATNVSGVGSPSIRYNNYLLEELKIEEINYTYHFYIDYPLVALKTIFLKFFGAFYFDYLWAYIPNLNPKEYVLTAVFSSIIFSLGITGLIFFRVKCLEYLIIIISLLSWTGLHIFSAMENRFAFYPMLILSVYLVKYIFNFPDLKYTQKRNSLMLCLIFFSCILYIGHNLFLTKNVVGVL